MKRALLAAAMLVLMGCWRTTVRNGTTPVGQTPIEYDNRWHSGLIYGLAELSGPYDLSKVCPANWSQIHTETENLASQRVAERAGFTREGVLRSYELIEGRPIDVVMFSALPGDLAG